MYFRGVYPLLLAALLTAGCATTPTARLHYSLQQNPDARPLQRVALLPIDVDVYEITLGGVQEEVPEWSDTAEDNIRSALLISRDSGGDCCVTERVDSSALSAQERALLEEHLLLYQKVAINALVYGSTWSDKKARFDYTLGDGLSFLKTRYGVDAGLIVIGKDQVSSSGRKTAIVVGALFGVSMPLGSSMLIGGLVDFETGDLLWLNRVITVGGASDLRDAESSLKMARQLMAGYPGLKATAAAAPEVGE